MLENETVDLLVECIQGVEQSIENILVTHLKEYSEYGMDNIANELISIQATLEVIRLKMRYKMIKGEENDD